MNRDEENRRIEEALLLSAWAEEESRPGEPEDDAGPKVEIPEEVLGLLDGTAQGQDAKRAQALLACDPRLTAEFGGLAASFREWPGRCPPADPPESLHREALGRVSREPLRRFPAWSWPGIGESVRALWCGPRVPVFAAMAATVLLVTFVVLDSGRSESGAPVYRSSGSGPQVVTRIGPEGEARVSGDVRFAWRALEEALAYRLILVSPKDGGVLELGPTADTSFVAEAGQLASTFRARGEQALLWTVRARLVDGTEVSSSPGTLRWVRPAN